MVAHAVPGAADDFNRVRLPDFPAFGGGHEPQLARQADDGRIAGFDIRPNLLLKVLWREDQLGVALDRDQIERHARTAGPGETGARRKQAAVASDHLDRIEMREIAL